MEKGALRTEGSGRVRLNLALHDEDSVQILKGCKEAIESNKNNGGKAIIIGLESDGPEAVETNLLSDISMMCCHGSNEHNKQEWHDIIPGACYSGCQICPARLGVDSVIEQGMTGDEEQGRIR